MFQYAFGLEASRRLSTTLAIDDAELRRLFVLGPAPADGTPTRTVTVENDAYDEPEDVLARLEDDTAYVGFFQSERFFPTVADDVRAAFAPRPEHVGAFRAVYSDLVGREYVCCHMRRTDYHTFAGGVALPMSYYAAALAQIAPPSGTPVVFVGDDLDEARAAFGSREDARFEHNDAVVDHQLLRGASAVVVSNSTFAWWGAWLNERQANVVAPRHWLGFGFGWEYPPKVVPPGWSQLRVKQPWRRRLEPAHLRMSLGRRRRDLASRLGRP
jgi:Glycosyl transferase family 11